MSKLDDKVIPALAERLRRPRGRSRVRRLDQRLVDDGPLAIVRDVPQLGFAVIGAVFLAGTISVAAQRTGDTNDGTGQDAVTVPGGTVSASQRLGAVPGDQVSAYLARAATSLGSSGSGERLALVSLSRYATPSEVSSLLQGLTTVRVYVRDPAAGADAARLSTDVSDLPGDLATYFDKVASGRTAASAAYKGYADSTTDDAASLADFRALQKAAAQEGVDYAKGCACVYAVVVRADKDALTQLRSHDGVRAVEPARSGGDLGTLAVDPLLPEDTTSVRASDAPTTIDP